MRKIFLAVGTRPEAIKMAPVATALARRRDACRLHLCTTAQHREMLDQVLALFDLTPDTDLDLMRPDQSLNRLAARILEDTDAVLAREKPDILLVQGDTTTSVAVALAAFYRRIPVGHVEAGLRTYNRDAPYPEEINRQCTTRLATWHFAPTQKARENLLNEGVAPADIHLTGNTIVDALEHMRGLIENEPPRRARLDAALASAGVALDDGSKLVLVTGHRRENFGDGLQAICTALKRLAQNRDDVRIVYPVHPNPNVRIPVEKALGASPHVNLVDPLDYECFVYLMMRATLILTDSGGIQEEAPSLRVPVLVMRAESERMEAVEAGTARLVGASVEGIVAETMSLLDDDAARARMVAAGNPFGDGRAGERIADILL